MGAGDDASPSGEPHEGHEAAAGPAAPAGRRPLGVVLLLAVALGAFALAWSSDGSDEVPPARTGVASATTLPAEVVRRWDVAVPGVGGPIGAGRAPVQLPGGAVAVADVVVDADGAVTATRPPGAVAGGRWAVAGTAGLVLGDVASGRVAAVRPWPAGLTATPTGPALAWVAAVDGVGPDDVVVATREGGAVRLGTDGSLRWTAEAVPLVADRAVTSGAGPLVPARARGEDEAAAVLDLRDGRVVARVGDGLRLLAVGHGLAVTADEDGVVAGWALAPGPVPAVLPTTDGPVWAVPMAPGRPVAVDVLSDQRLAVHGMDTVVGEVRLVDGADGAVIEVVAGWPNADLDGGRTAEAFDDVVVGVVGDELRGFAWDGTPRSAVPLGSEGWFVTRGPELVQLVSRRTGAVLLVDRRGTPVPAGAPPPATAAGARLVPGGGRTVGLAGGVAAPTAVRWVDAATGEVDVAPPPGPVAADGLVGADGPGDVGAGVLGLAGPVGGDRVLVEAGAVVAVGENGTERWRHALSAPPALVTLVPGAHPGLVVTSAHVVVPLADGTVLGLAREDGAVAWTAATGVVTAVVGAGEEVLVARADGTLLRVAVDGRLTVLAELGAPVTALTVADDVVVALLPGRLVGIGPPGGPVPAEDRVDLSAPAHSSGAVVSSPANWWHAAPRTPSSTPGG